MIVYQSSEAPSGSQRAKLCYRGSWEYIRTLRQCDVSKYTQQACIQTRSKDKKTHQIALTTTNTHCLHSLQNAPWNGMDGLLFNASVSQCVCTCGLCMWMNDKRVCMKEGVLVYPTELRDCHSHLESVMIWKECCSPQISEMGPNHETAVLMLLSDPLCFCENRKIWSSTSDQN